MRAEREGMVAQGATLRNEYETFATDRMNLEQKAKLLKLQEKQKKKEGKKLSKQEKELGKKEMKALKMEAERKVLAGEPLTPEEQRVLYHISGGGSGHGGDDIAHDKNKKKADKRTKQIQKELMEIDFKLEKLMMERQQFHHELTSLGEPIQPAVMMPGQPGVGVTGGVAPIGAGVPSIV